jgi:hypothetical protein
MDEKTISDRCYDIFKTVFQSNLSHIAFRYKHYENPHGLSTPLFVEKTGDDIKGINGFMAAKFICESQELYAAQSCDSAVLAQYRDKDVFKSIIKNAQKQLQSAGVDFLFGFPNQNSYPGFIKLGWKHEVDFCRYFLPIQWHVLLQNKIGRKCAGIAHTLLSPITLSRVNRLATKPFKVTIKSYDLCPFTEEDCATINNCGKIMIKRSIEYYEWKLDKNPTRNFKYIVAKEEGRLYGFIVYYVGGGEVNIVDWFCVSDNKYLIMAKLIKQLINEGTKINALLINAESNEVEFMKRLGFWNSANRILKRKKSPLVIYILNPALEDKLHAPEKWSLRYIDSDTIIS